MDRREFIKGDNSPTDGQVGYSLVEHIARAVWVTRYAEGNLMGMYALTSYYDASYDGQKTVTIVSGWLASIGAWQRFETDWRILLAKHDVPYFTMKEFAHSRGVFETWKGEENKRANFLRDAVDIISQNVLRGFACAVRHDAFEHVNAEFELSERMGNPYSLAGRGCIALTNNWLAKNQRLYPIQYIFDRGDEGKGRLIKLLEEHKLPEPIFKPSRDTESEPAVVPLQAADFAAYELLKAIKDFGEDAPMYKYRRSFQELAKVPADWEFYTEEWLYGFCKNASIKPRVLG